MTPVAAHTRPAASRPWEVCHVTWYGLPTRLMIRPAAGEGRVARHAHRAWERLEDEEREKRSRRNYDRLVKRFAGLGVGT